MSQSLSSPFQPHWNLYPNSYLVPKISYPLLDHLDGDLSKDVWKNVSFSELFDDIRGAKDAPSKDRPNKSCRTRFKAVYGDTHLFIGAILESDFETQAHFTERNAPIFQKDSDFEVFVDPFGSCHHYKELEVNAINTPWNLMLDKPYDDGGVEHSGRIAKPGDDLYYEVKQQKTAVRVLHGKLNDPENPAVWTVELALAYQDLFACTGKEFVPGPGALLRINMSRVELRGKINWTWQPQIVWNPTNRTYSGYVAMHLPDAWGYFVFGEKQKKQDQNVDIPKDPSWPGRLAAMNIYYAQKTFSEQQQQLSSFSQRKYASTAEELNGLVDDPILEPFQIEIELTYDGYIATITGNPDGSVVTVTQDRLLRVATGSNRQDSVVEK
ncbi:MAG: hypothetical protein SGARI_000947 [Bacillariaceae sp.]